MPVSTPAKSKCTTISTFRVSRSTLRPGSNKPRDDGELWASSTVRDLMLGGAATFEDRGEYTLKGIDGTWRLFAVTSD